MVIKEIKISFGSRHIKAADFYACEAGIFLHLSNNVLPRQVSSQIRLKLLNWFFLGEMLNNFENVLIDQINVVLNLIDFLLEVAVWLSDISNLSFHLKFQIILSGLNTNFIHLHFQRLHLSAPFISCVFVTVFLIHISAKMDVHLNSHISFPAE